MSEHNNEITPELFCSTYLWNQFILCFNCVHNNIHKRDYREAYAPFHSEPFTEYILFTMNIHLGAEKKLNERKKHHHDAV